jgi:hypothetical protein
MGTPGRWFSDRDRKFIESISAELYGDVVQTEVTIFKACPDQTPTNIYGESKPSVGKQYYPGIDIVALIDRAEIATEVDDFGPDRKQNVVFKFREKMLRVVNLFPSTGDIVLFNERYHEIDDVAQEQFLGGVAEKSYSIICNCHYSKLSSKDIVVRQS